MLDDLVAEGDEFLTVTLSNPVGVVLGTASANLVVLENDVVELSITDASVGESAGNVPVAVTASLPATYAVTVNFTTSDGSANSGSDYSAASGSYSTTLISSLDERIQVAF